MNRWRLSLALAAVLFGFAGAAHADPCQTIVVEREPGRALGECMSDGGACTDDAACTGHDRDYCVHGVLAGSPGERCYGGDDCLEHITFELDREYECGAFVNGDPWVLDDGGGVVITRITPDHLPGCESGGECRNGWEVTQLINQQSLSSHAAVFEARTPALPYSADGSSGPASLIKAMDARIQGGCDDRQNCFLHAAVLTVVGQVPALDAFRPHFSGPERPVGFHTFCDVNVTLRPSLPVDMAPATLSIEEASRFFSTPFLGKNGRNSSLQQNMTLYQSYLGSAGTAALVTGYHAQRSNRVHNALLRMLLSDFDPVNDPEHRLAFARAILLSRA